MQKTESFRIHSFLQIMYKVSRAILSTIMVLLANKHLGPSGAGSQVAVMYFGGILASLVWGKWAVKRDNRYVAILITFAGYLSASVVAYFSFDLLTVLLGTFMFAFFAPASYYAWIAMIREMDHYEKRVAKYEKIGGFSWALGLMIGSFLTSRFTLNVSVLIVSALSLFSILIIVFAFREKLLERLASMFLKDFGLLMKIEKSIEKITKIEEMFLTRSYMPTSDMMSTSLFPSLLPMKIRIPKQMLKFHGPFLFLAFILGLTTQIVPFEKYVGIPNNVVFLFSLMATILTSIMFGYAASIKNYILAIRKCMYVRLITYILIAIAFLYQKISIPALIMYFVVDGTTWGITLVSIELHVLKYRKNEFGENNFFRSVGRILGSLAGGFISSLLGFHATFIIAAFLGLFFIKWIKSFE
ncbi:MAG: MFS transporter [Candidatus Aenigmarchaeota archaeon]|nr:MFS transporter [Candidatus Aenigmarchaeota archaeon]